MDDIVPSPRSADPAVEAMYRFAAINLFHQSRRRCPEGAADEVNCKITATLYG